MNQRVRWRRQKPFNKPEIMMETKPNEGIGSPIKRLVVFDEAARERYAKARRELKAKLRPWTEAILDARRLSKDDLAIRINARD